MIHLNKILRTLNKDKQQEFINYLDKKNKRKDAKNIQLVKLLLADNFSSQEISEKIYGTQNKVALHALRKRLFQSLIDFTANTSIKEENSLDIRLIKYIIAARNFLQKEQIEVGYQILEKARIVATEHQLFSILNEIYHTKIQYAHQHETLNLEEIIHNFKENQQQLIQEDNLNIAYANIRKSLNDYQQKKTTVDIKKLIESTLKKQNNLDISLLSFKSLYQLLQITTISSSQKFDYYNITNFAVDTYKIVKNHTSKNKQTYYHIEILYVISNIFFRDKKFNQSLKYLELMNFYMKANKQKYLKEFSSKHDLLLALNFNYTEKQEEAIQLLESTIDKKNINIIHQLDIYLSLIVCYFQNKSLTKAQNLLSKLYHTDKWYLEKAGLIWTIKKNLIDILLQIDCGNINLVESRLKSFKKNYFKHLKEIDQENVIIYLKLVEIYYKSPEKVSSKEFYNKVETSFNFIDKEKEDIFMMSFYAWLKAKMTKQNVYLVTLKLINS
jgi:hypothetical protein